jgi:radical SAM protein with 4Fe4S-binding SPASM domain
VRPSEGLEGKAAGAEGPEAWPGVTPRTFRPDAAAREPRSRPQQARVPTGAPDWFDEKLVGLARLPMPETARCGFGDGEVAVAPSGRLYPCERLIGEDHPGNPMRLPGHVSDGTDFLSLASPPCRAAGECARCDIGYACSTTCRCSNYVRTGDPTQPDGLLCRLNKACARLAAQVALDVSEEVPPPASPSTAAAAG